jgi:hypothetical protein
VSDSEVPDRRWCGGAPVRARDVMGDWLELIGASSPWDDMPLDDLAGEFYAVLDELLEPKGELATDPRASRLRRVSRAHGAFRRRQGCAPLVLREEVGFAEEAIELALARGGTQPAVIAVIHDSLAIVLHSIERAAYGGYVDCADPPFRD